MASEPVCEVHEVTVLLGRFWPDGTRGGHGGSSRVSLGTGDGAYCEGVRVYSTQAGGSETEERRTRSWGFASLLRGRESVERSRYAESLFGGYGLE